MNETIAGYTLDQQRAQYQHATARHGDNLYAIKNHLKKHYYYTEDEAWQVINNFSFGGFSFEKEKDYLVSTDTNNYIVMNKVSREAITGDDAKTFLALAEKLGIPRDSYRV